MSFENESPVDPLRRAWLKAAAVGGAALAAGSLALAPAGFARGQGTAQTLRIGYQKYGPLVLLKVRGTLEKRLGAQGVSVSWLEFPAGPQLLEGLNAGAADFATVGETPPVFAQAAGIDFVYVGNEPPAPATEAIVVQHDSTIKAVANLRGKKIALNKGSNVHYLLVRALQHAKLDYADIQPVYLAPADARAAFEKGSVDAWAIWDPYLAAIQKQAGARVLVDGTGLVGNVEFYLASRKFAAEHPQHVHAVLDELAKADAWAKANPAEVARILAPQIGLDASIVEIAARRTSYGVQPVSSEVFASQQKIADTFSDLRLIPKRLVVKDAQWIA
jgi:sulfonate transport system substrate-binding protein